MSLAASVPTCSDGRLKFNTLHSHGSVVFVLSSFFCVIFLTLVSTLRIKKADADLAAWGFFFSDARLRIVFRDDNRINFIYY